MGSVRSKPTRASSLYQAQPPRTPLPCQAQPLRSPPPCQALLLRPPRPCQAVRSQPSPCEQFVCIGWAGERREQLHRGSAAAEAFVVVTATAWLGVTGRVTCQQQQQQPPAQQKPLAGAGHHSRLLLPAQTAHSAGLPVGRDVTSQWPCHTCAVQVARISTSQQC